MPGLPVVLVYACIPPGAATKVPAPFKTTIAPVFAASASTMRSRHRAVVQVPAVRLRPSCRSMPTHPPAAHARQQLGCLSVPHSLQTSVLLHRTQLQLVCRQTGCRSSLSDPAAAWLLQRLVRLLCRAQHRQRCRPEAAWLLPYAASELSAAGTAFAAAIAAETSPDVRMTFRPSASITNVFSYSSKSFVISAMLSSPSPSPGPAQIAS